ncbi:hypothetical protein CTAYLR_003289 [Chrysophaeum taylorii]|uniref:Uncharacterized protein n=1 Tax=Chrysophaeum taylorii TaxID=2483200 RepID=A0AAD7UAW4_9STRA|nr:hypothetical protein CTAYLR_003289 [Chrysophaeum taylorii]
MLIRMNAAALHNGVDDECSVEEKRRMLRAMVDSNAEWLYEWLDSVSESALEAFARSRIVEQAHVVEISKLFDKAGVENHKGELLRMMVPGRGYDPDIDDNVQLPRGVRSCASASARDLAEFVELGVINWIRWFIRQHSALRQHVCRIAARAGNLDVISWARANDCPWDEWTCLRAAAGGHLHVLMWAHANECPWNSLTCLTAARGGHLEVLKWARANQCPWDEATCWHAAIQGHLEVLQWARANGCPWNQRKCAASAHAAVRAWVLGQTS